MNLFKHLTVIFLSIIIIGCGSNNGQKKSDFKIKTNTKNNTVFNNEILSLSIDNPKNHLIDSVSYSFNNKPISESVDLSHFKLGKHTLGATVYFNNDQQFATQKLIILNKDVPKIFTYKIINEYPHDITCRDQRAPAGVDAGEPGRLQQSFSRPCRIQGQ